jgi:hypothetical protein
MVLIQMMAQQHVEPHVSVAIVIAHKSLHAVRGGSNLKGSRPVMAFTTVINLT